MRSLPRMQVTLHTSDDDTEPEVLVLDLDSMPMREAEECESLTGWTRQEWLEALFKDRARAVKFFIYLARQRNGDPCAWDGIDFDLGKTEWEALDGEPDDAAKPADLGVAEGVGPTGPEAEQQPTLDASPSDQN